MLRLLEARDQRDATRFGLVWEANEIERDKALNNDFVALDLVQKQSVGAAPWRNLIIEGDNYDALRYLRMTFAGQVKCILIDPPYNTGNDDFIYNDRFVSKEDSWRHSTWLEFMYRRLTLARDLLREDGVLFVHIGEDEVQRLGCLLDKVFPGRKVGTFVWRTRSGANDSKEYFRSIDHEYVLCYANPNFTFGGYGKALEDYANPDKDKRGDWVSADLSKARPAEGEQRAVGAVSADAKMHPHARGEARQDSDVDLCIVADGRSASAARRRCTWIMTRRRSRCMARLSTKATSSPLMERRVAPRPKAQNQVLQPVVARMADAEWHDTKGLAEVVFDLVWARVSCRDSRPFSNSIRDHADDFRLHSEDHLRRPLLGPEYACRRKETALVRSP